MLSHWNLELFVIAPNVTYPDLCTKKHIFFQIGSFFYVVDIIQNFSPISFLPHFCTPRGCEYQHPQSWVKHVWLVLANKLWVKAMCGWGCGNLMFNYPHWANERTCVLNSTATTHISSHWPGLLSDCRIDLHVT